MPLGRSSGDYGMGYEGEYLAVWIVFVAVVDRC
jgi:hypothetical protein